jgi:hypothetical protein
MTEYLIGGALLVVFTAVIGWIGAAVSQGFKGLKTDITGLHTKQDALKDEVGKLPGIVDDKIKEAMIDHERDEERGTVALARQVGNLATAVESQGENTRKIHELLALETEQKGGLKDSVKPGYKVRRRRGTSKPPANGDRRRG